MNTRDAMKSGPDETLVFKRASCLTDRATHYCPGCHHGIAHRLTAEVIDELGLREKTVMAASVGCSAFIYDYLDVDCIEAPHGRASAVACGVKRARPDRVAFAYQGDGDLAAIGTNEALHAANRGEAITVIFINNTVYGMTGGQMAPTTLLGQKTTTTPRGRSFDNEGAPLRMAELMALLDGVFFSARCALNCVKNVIAAKKAIRAAFETQTRHNGYGFVELLSGCPTNWHMDAPAANEHIGKAMIPAFPLGTFKDMRAAGKNVA